MPQKKTFNGQIIQVQLEMAYQLLLFAISIKVTEMFLFTIYNLKNVEVMEV